jgi:putative two-component system response regulator
LQPKHKILIVDDLIENIDLLSRFLTSLDFEVQAARSGEEALISVEQEQPDLILLDLMLPGLTGYEVCSRLKQSPATWHIPVIIITGNSDRDANIQAVGAGADDFLAKPFDRALLEARLKTSLRNKILQDQLYRYQHELEGMVQERTQQVEITQQVTVFSLARLAESRDTETGDHLERMRSYARELAEEMCSWEKFSGIMDNGFVTALYHSTPLHDIGKVGIPDNILLKPGKLSPREFDIMKTHTLIGGDTLRAADLEAGQNSFLAMGRDIAFHHHEKWDGTGYPDGLSGENIPLAARITALADVYDALSSKRPYKEPFSHEKSRSIILEGAGTHFDPDVIEAFLRREERFINIREVFQGQGKLSPIQMLMEGLAKEDDS